jgi:DNA polymerase III epsilon subunit-like protein
LGIRHNGVDTHNKVNVIDTQIVARKEVERMIAIQPRWKTGRPPRGKTKLKHLAESLCGQTIQADLINGHDCVEDAYATREVLLAMEHSRLDLEDWATEYVRRSRIQIVGPPM